MNLKFARKDIEKLYIDSCSIYEYQNVVKNYITNKEEVLVHENVPCKITHKTITSASSGVFSGISLTSKLIINPEIVIKPGSKILVTRDGVTTAYKSSGQPARYTNHQEIILELEDERA